MARMAPDGAWRQRLVGAGALLLAAAAQAQAQVHDLADRATAVQLSGSVLRIEAPRLRGGYSMGSGVVVGPELVVTNCHVTRESTQISVLRGGVRWRVTAQRADTARDLCLLQVPGLVAPVVALTDADALIGQRVTALGYTGGLDLQHSFGEVVELHRLAGGSVLQTSNGFNSGASGGGLFDAGGRLLGVLTFRLRGGEQHYYAAPASWVRSLVAGAGSDGLAPVAPLDPLSVPYWQWPGERQPRFLRASLLLHQQRWDALAELARDWLIDDPLDGEPWHLLGLALGRLDQPDAARQALDCALRLQPQRRQTLAGADDVLAETAASRPPADEAVGAPRVAAAIACPGTA